MNQCKVSWIIGSRCNDDIIIIIYGTDNGNDGDGVVVGGGGILEGITVLICYYAIDI
jgi:hypothetical protein